GGEGAHGGSEGVVRAEQPVVDDGFARLCRERRVDERRLAGRDGVAADDVAALDRGHHRPVSVASSPSSREKRKREGIASWSAWRFIAVVKRPYGAAAWTIATARRSSTLLPEPRTTSVSRTRPSESTVMTMVSSPYSFLPWFSGKLRVPRSSILRRSLS